MDGSAGGGTATTLARTMIVQTQTAAALAQQAADRRQEQNQEPIVFMWKWGLPIFIVAVAGLGLWGLWRWLKIHTARPRNVAQPAGGLVIVWERVGGLAESLPNLLRWMAWFVETRSTAPAPAGRPHPAVVVASMLNPAVAAEPAVDITSGPTPDPENLLASSLDPDIAEVAAAAPPAVTTIRNSLE